MQQEVPMQRLRTARRLIACLFLILAVTAVASIRLHAKPEDKQFGKVNFPTSCAPQVQAAFEKGVALLHSFQYQESEQAFSQVLKSDHSCAIAYWGKAMSLDHQLWEFPSPANMAEGRKDVAEAQELGTRSELERDYIDAAAAFYEDDPKLTNKARVQAYSAAMEKLSRDNPKDSEGAAFYALSLVSLAQYGVNDLSNRKKAVAILNPLFAQQPDNPGVAHYLIHATDTPELAAQGLPAARAYAKIAPDSSHAIHMPSHIFRRLGLWQDVIDSNIAAEAAAAEATEAHRGDAGYQTHAMGFRDYAYLQTGQEANARHVVEELDKVPGGKPEEIADKKAELAAQNAIELHRWKEAAALPIPKERVTWQDITYWARTIGAARSGDVAATRQNMQKLVEVLEASNKKSKLCGYDVTAGESVEEREAEAWVSFAEGNADDAVKQLRSAAEKEEAEDSDPFSVPAREMLADLLFELKRPSEALAEYETVLKNFPNRFDAVYGAARAAEAASKQGLSREYYSKLVAISAPGADRPELRKARAYVAASGN
jgi:Tetratricopeptide repeat